MEMEARSGIASVTIDPSHLVARGYVISVSRDATSR